MFEVEVSGIEPFRNLVRALAAVVDEGCFNVDEARIWLLAMDSSRVAARAGGLNNSLSLWGEPYSIILEIG